MSHVDASLARYTKLKIQPFNPLIGATVHGVDLADVSNETLRAELRRALAEFQVLFFRAQTITPEQQLALARVFGDPEKAKAFFPRLDGHKAVEVIEKAPNVPRYGTDQWHAPTGYRAVSQRPARGGHRAEKRRR
jgi:taurine dioxygenase